MLICDFDSFWFVLCMRMETDRDKMQRTTIIAVVDDAACKRYNMESKIIILSVIHLASGFIN